MARVRMVTRTVELTMVEVMCLNTETAEVTIESYELTGKFDTEKDMMKALKCYNTDTHKLVKIQTVSTQEILYGMPESEFIKLATVLPNR